jgi:mannose-6-phosphate isomerase
MTGNECRFASGPFAGQKLGDVWPKMPPLWAGTHADLTRDFPLLVKFIFAEQKLSVQVHPDDEFARKHEPGPSSCGKTEMWYALCAREGAEVLLGLKPSVTAEKFKRAIVDGTAEDLLEHVPMRPGDVIFVPAGTTHTIGGGLVLCEIQQHSDITYRVYDYNRRDAQGKLRDLHIEKALQVIQFGEQSGGKVDPVSISRGAVTETYFVACRYFATEKWGFAERIASTSSPEHFDLLIFLEGHGSIHWGSESVNYAPAQTWLLPAALGAYQLNPAAGTTLLRTYVPKHVDELARKLADQGISESAWSRLVYP